MVTAAMVQELEDNKRATCSHGRQAVTAAILMAAEEQGMKVKVFNGGAGGRVVDRVADAHQWAVEASWVKEAEEAVVLERWQGLAIRRGSDAPDIMIKIMGVGWEVGGKGPQRYSGRYSTGW